MIIAIINQKGGTGKTTTAVNAGTALAALGHKVLLVDLDPQASLTYSLGISDFKNSISELLLLETTLDEVTVSREGMNIVPSNIDLADLEFAIAKLEDGRESLLKKALNGSENYDFVLIDCPPSLSLLTVNALVVADKVIIPLQMEVLSLQGLDHILGTIKKITKVVNGNLEIMGVLPVMVDKRRNLSTEIHDYIKVNFKDVHVFENYIRTNVRTTEAPSFGKSVINYAPKSNGAKDYLAFAREFQQINSKQLV